MSAFRDRHAERLEDLGLPHLAQAVRDYRCACGCGEQLHGGGERVLYVDPRHRQRAYRRRLEAEAKAAGIPARLSLETVQAARSTTARNADAQTRRAAPRRRRPSRPRDGVSAYFPSIDVAEAVLECIEACGDYSGAPMPVGADIARDAIAKALERRRRRNA